MSHIKLGFPGIVSNYTLIFSFDINDVNVARNQESLNTATTVNSTTSTTAATTTTTITTTNNNDNNMKYNPCV